VVVHCESVQSCGTGRDLQAWGLWSLVCKVEALENFVLGAEALKYLQVGQKWSDCGAGDVVLGDSKIELVTKRKKIECSGVWKVPDPLG